MRLELTATLCLYFALAVTLCFNKERSAGTRVVEFKQVLPNWWPLYALIRGHFTLQVTYRLFQVPQPAEDEQLAQARFALGAGQPGDPLHDPANRFFMVPQSGQDRNYTVTDGRALQQSITIQRANIDRAITKREVGAIQFGFHAKRNFTDVDQDLPWKPLEQPENPGEYSAIRSGMVPSFELCNSR